MTRTILSLKTTINSKPIRLLNRIQGATLGALKPNAQEAP